MGGQRPQPAGPHQSRLEEGEEEQGKVPANPSPTHNIVDEPRKLQDPGRVGSQEWCRCVNLGKALTSLA